MNESMLRRLPSYLLMLVICFVHIIPFFILFNLATKSPEDTTSKWLPATYVYLDNFKNAWQNAFLDQALLNNVIITTATVVLVVVLGSLAAYPLARFPTRLYNIVYTVIV